MRESDCRIQALERLVDELSKEISALQEKIKILELKTPIIINNPPYYNPPYNPLTPMWPSSPYPMIY